MARKRKTEKIEELDSKIQELIKEREKQLERLERHIGKLVIKNWGTYDEENLEEVITSLAENAKELLTKKVPLNNQTDTTVPTENSSVDTSNTTY